MQTPTTSWRKLLSEPGENGHIVQLYQDDDFYGEAISHFAAEGLARGESIILVATQPHWKNISGRLRGKVAVVNQTPTWVDREAALVLHDKAGNVLEAVAAGL